MLRSNIAPAELLEIMRFCISEWQDTLLDLGNEHCLQTRTDTLSHAPFATVLQLVETIAVKSCRLPLEVKPS